MQGILYSKICLQLSIRTQVEASICVFLKDVKDVTVLVAVMYFFPIIMCRQRYIPLVSRCCQRGGEARLSRRAHNPQSGFHFCKIASGRKFKSTPRYHYFLKRNLVFSRPYLCNGFVKCLCAFGVGMYNPVLILRSCSIEIFLVL